MSDEPLCGLPRTAVLCDLAKTIWYARALVYHLDVPHFDALDVAERHQWIQKAADILQSLAPAPEPPSMFDVAVKLARVQAAKVLAFGDPVIDGRD